MATNTTPLAEIPPSGGWKPTRKWWAAFAGSAAAILGSLIESGDFDVVERGMIAAALISLAGAYFISNDDTPGGVPDAKSSA